MKGTFWGPAMAVDPVPHLEGLGFNKEDMLHRLGQAFPAGLARAVQREDAAAGQASSTDRTRCWVLNLHDGRHARHHHLKLVRQLTAMVSGASSRELIAP